MTYAEGKPETPPAPKFWDIGGGYSAPYGWRPRDDRSQPRQNDGPRDSRCLIRLSNYAPKSRSSSSSSGFNTTQEAE